VVGSGSVRWLLASRMWKKVVMAGIFEGHSNKRFACRYGQWPESFPSRARSSVFQQKGGRTRKQVVALAIERFGTVQRAGVARCLNKAKKIPASGAALLTRALLALRFPATRAQTVWLLHDWGLRLQSVTRSLLFSLSQTCARIARL